MMNLDKERVARMLSERTRREGEHLIWKGALVDGYGNMKIDNKTYKAHRLSAILYVPGYFEEAVAMHLCDRRDCLEPTHLRWGTRQENAIDVIETGGNRQSRNKGRMNGMSKLSDEEIHKIKELCANGVNQYLIADFFGVRQSCISRIKHGHRRG